MNVLILGGQSPRHMQWVRMIEQTIKLDVESVTIFDYEHWLVNDPSINLALEIERAGKLADSLGDYIIIAKSIGTVVAILMQEQILKAPKGCVFMGMPLQTAVQENKDQIVKLLPKLTNVQFLQNSADPLGGTNELKRFLQTTSPQNYKIHTSENSTHDYVDFELIKKLTENAINE